MVPIPFTQYLPALLVMAVAIAYLESDGVILAASLVAAILSIGVSGVEIWGAWSGLASL